MDPSALSGAEAAPDARICCACGGKRFTESYRVAGEVGEAGLIPTTVAYGTALADIVRCVGCGHRQLDPMPAADRLAALYEIAESADYVDQRAGQIATADRVLDRIEQFSGPGRIGDLGCWVGFLLIAAEARGWSGQGVEPSQWAADYGRREHGLDVQCADLFNAELVPGSFDAIVLGDVIEHLVDPGAALDRIATLLAPGGVLALALPDAGSRLARLMGRRWWAVIPTHVQYFSRDSVSALLRAHRFGPLLIETQPKVFSVGYYLGRIGGYSERLGRIGVRVAARIGVAERLWAPDFGDRMLVIARLCEPED